MVKGFEAERLCLIWRGSMSRRSFACGHCFFYLRSFFFFFSLSPLLSSHTYRPFFFPISILSTSLSCFNLLLLYFNVFIFLLYLFFLTLVFHLHPTLCSVSSFLFLLSHFPFLLFFHFFFLST